MEENNMNQILEKQEKKKIPTIFKILMIVGPIILITGIVLLATGFGDFENESKFIIGMFLMPVGFISTVVGFIPLISKASIKANKYILQSNMEDLQDISSTSADITSTGIKKAVRAVKEGWTDEENKPKSYCPNCGAKLEGDDNFCSQCGSKIEK